MTSGVGGTGAVPFHAQLAARYVGLREVAGKAHDPLIVAMIRQAGGDPLAGDETPWCGAFVNWVAWNCGLERPKLPLRARSWLTVGEPVDVREAMPGDVLVFSRRVGDAEPPGAEVLDAPGHVCFLARWLTTLTGGLPRLLVLGGNQGAGVVSVVERSIGPLLGVRRLRPVTPEL